MATSSTSTFEIARDAIVTAAVYDVVGFGATISQAMRNHANDRLSELVKALDGEGVRLWKVAIRTATLTDGTASFSPAADVMSIDGDANYRTSSTATSRSPVTPISRDEYYAIADRTVEGTPTNYYVAYALSGQTVYLYPVPDTTGAVLEYPAVIKTMDMDSGSVTLDFPQRWILTLRWGLAMLLCPVFNQMNRLQAFRDLFEGEKTKQMMDDTERGDIQFAPFLDSEAGD